VPDISSVPPGRGQRRRIRMHGLLLPQGCRQWRGRAGRRPRHSGSSTTPS